MKRFIKKNYKILIGFVLGILVSGVGVYAASNILATNVTYTPSDSSWNVNNTASALDNLYDYYEASKYVKQKDCVQGSFVCTGCTTSTGQKILDFNPNSLWMESITGYKYIVHYDKSIDLNNFSMLYLNSVYTSGQNNYYLYKTFPINEVFKFTDGLIVYGWGGGWANATINYVACK